MVAVFVVAKLARGHPHAAAREFGEVDLPEDVRVAMACADHFGKRSVNIYSGSHLRDIVLGIQNLNRSLHLSIRQVEVEYHLQTLGPKSKLLIRSKVIRVS